MDGNSVCGRQWVQQAQAVLQGLQAHSSRGLLPQGPDCSSWGGATKRHKVHSHNHLQKIILLVYL